MGAPFVSWIASYPRSGNTWVRALLLAYRHGEVFDLDRMQDIPGEPGPAHYRLLWSGKEPYDDLDWAHMRAVALRNYYEMRRTNDFVLKTHTANITVNGVDLIPRGYTNKAIYVLRDPRDVLCSCATYFGKTHEEFVDLMLETGHCLTDELSGMRQFVSSYANHVAGWTKEKEFPVHVVRYGELLRDAGTQLARILNFLDPEHVVDLRRVRAAVEMTSIERFKAHERRYGFRERPPGVDQFFGEGEEGAWKGKLDPKLEARLLVGLGITGKATQGVEG